MLGKISISFNESYLFQVQNAVTNRGNNTVITENKSSEDFLAEYTRVKLVEWCAAEILGDGPFDLSQTHPKLVQVALEIGWITKRTPHAITAKGYSVAASFLRR